MRDMHLHTYVQAYNTATVINPHLNTHTQTHKQHNPSTPPHPWQVLRVNYAQPVKVKGGDKGWAHQAVWADADDYYDRQMAEQELERLDKEQLAKARAEQERQVLGTTTEETADPMAALEAAAG